MSDILKSTNSELPQTPTTYCKAPPPSAIKSAPVKSYRDDEKFDDSIQLDTEETAEFIKKLQAKIQIADDLKEASVEPQASDNESTLTSDIDENENESSSQAQLSENELAPQLEAVDTVITSFDVEPEAEAETQYMAEVNPSFYSQEMDDALEHVRELALYHQEKFVNSLCDTFVQMNGSEPSVNDLVAVFGRIQSTFAQEAIEEELEQDETSDSDEEESDSDYDPNSIRDRQQMAEDAVEDEFDSADGVESGSELEELSDSDYDPQDIEDLEQVQADLDEDVFDSEESVVLEYGAGVEEEEDAIINLEEFDAEYADAIRSAQIVANFDAEKIVQKIKNEYSEEYGEEYVKEVIDISLSGIRDAQTEAIEESEEETEENDEEQEIESEEELDEEEVAVLEQEMYWALDNVRKLAKYHQQEFVEKICDIYTIYNGFEPNADEICSIFSDIKEEFAYEAEEEILEECDDLIEDIGVSASEEEEAEKDEEESADDSDYDPSNALDVQQFDEDEEADWTTEDEEEQSLWK